MRALEEGWAGRTRKRSWVWIPPVVLFLAFCLVTFFQVVRLPGGILTLLGCTCPACPGQQTQPAGAPSNGSQTPQTDTATASKPATQRPPPWPPLVPANPIAPPIVNNDFHNGALAWWRLPHPLIDRIRTTTPTFPPASPAVQAAAVDCLRTAFVTDKPLDMRVYSQWGEDGILEGIFKCIGVTDKKYVEFGTENGKERSTRWLQVGHGFTGLLMDGGYENPEINLRKEFIFADTISQVLHKNGAPFPTMDHMTIDIDMNTWHVTLAVMRAGWRPRSLMVEYNRNFLPHQSYVVEYIREQMWTAEDCYFGASALAYDRVLAQFDYQIVAVDQYGVNLFYVHKSALGWPKGEVHANTPAKLHPLQQVWLHLHRGCAERTWVEVPEGKDVDFKTWDFNTGRKALLHQHERPDQIRVLYEAAPGDEAQKDVTYGRYTMGNYTIHHRHMVLHMGDMLVHPNNAGYRISTLNGAK